MVDDVDGRAELIRRIEARRSSINAFVRRVRPRNARLANISIVSSAAAAAFTAVLHWVVCPLRKLFNADCRYRIARLCGGFCAFSLCLCPS